MFELIGMCANCVTCDVCRGKVYTHVSFGGYGHSGQKSMRILISKC